MVVTTIFDENEGRYQVNFKLKFKTTRKPRKMRKIKLI